VTLYTCVWIDWDLLRDDLESAEGLIPARAYKTLEEAKAAGQRMIEEEAEEAKEANGEYPEWNGPLQWDERPQGGWQAGPYGDDYLATIVINELEVDL
jgi:hypothetical protein